MLVCILHYIRCRHGCMEKAELVIQAAGSLEVRWSVMLQEWSHNWNQHTMSFLPKYITVIFLLFFLLEIMIHLTPYIYMNGRATTRGVFKAYVFFFHWWYSSFSVNMPERQGLQLPILLKATETYLTHLLLSLIQCVWYSTENGHWMMTSAQEHCHV